MTDHPEVTRISSDNMINPLITLKSRSHNASAVPRHRSPEVSHARDDAKVSITNEEKKKERESREHRGEEESALAAITKRTRRFNGTRKAGHLTMAI